MFNEFGHYTGPRIPDDCVIECTAAGQPADDAVEHWARVLDFEVPRVAAINYLARTGSATREELASRSDEYLAEFVLWIACCNMLENGDWLGLCE
jgi:hypothetical protein